MSSFSGIDTLPSVEPIIMLFPDDDLPNSFDILTVMVSILPSNFFTVFHIYVLLRSSYSIFRSSGKVQLNNPLLLNNSKAWVCGLIIPLHLTYDILASFSKPFALVF